jgi:hypothetical protein
MAKAGPDDGGGKTEIIVAIEIERIAITNTIRPETGIPGVVVGWQIVLLQRTRVGTIGRIAHGVLLIISGGLLLVQGPVTAGERSGDQDKLDAGGFFHNAARGKTAE